MAAMDFINWPTEQVSRRLKTTVAAIPGIVSIKGAEHRAGSRTPAPRTRPDRVETPAIQWRAPQRETLAGRY